MTDHPTNRKPTNAEIKILRVIWEHGTLSVRQVYDFLSQREKIGHTTVLKIMQIMTEKGLLARDTTVRPQIFRAAQPQRQTQKLMLRDLLDRAFGGSPGDLALQALSIRKSTPRELREIRDLLDKLEEENS